MVGVGLIGSIEESIGTKTHSRCPTCGSSKFEMRERLQPKYRSGFIDGVCVQVPE